MNNASMTKSKEVVTFCLVLNAIIVIADVAVFNPPLIEKAIGKSKELVMRIGKSKSDKLKINKNG